MITQKLISFKCDANQLESFDSLVAELGTNRNKLLNFLVYYANNELRNNVFKLRLTSIYSDVMFSF